MIRGAVALLEPIKVSTKIFEAEKHPTINYVVERLFVHQEELDGFIKSSSNCQYGIGFARSLKKNLNLRFPDCGTEVIENRLANFLDPRLKGVHLQMFKKYNDTKDDALWFAKELSLISDEGTETLTVVPAPTPSGRVWPKLW